MLVIIDFIIFVPLCLPFLSVSCGFKILGKLNLRYNAIRVSASLAKTNKDLTDEMSIICRLINPQSATRFRP